MFRGICSRGIWPLCSRSGPNGRVRRNAVRSQGHMDCAEPLILKYELRNWMNHDYRGSDKMRLAQPEVKERYRGLLRDKKAAVPAYMVSRETTANEMKSE